MPPVSAFRNEEGNAWIGYFGKLGQYPVILNGSSKENLMERAQAFWEQESAKAKAVLGSNREPVEAAPVARSPVAAKAVEKAVESVAKPGVGKAHFGGTIWINKAGSVKRIRPEELPSYQKQGWRQGRR
jgi:hypothetical protein